MLVGGGPIPVHFPTQVVTDATYDVLPELGYFLGYPTAEATWNLPSTALMVLGAPLWISNRSATYGITLVPDGGDSLEGPALVAPGCTAEMVVSGTTLGGLMWRVLGVTAENGGPAPTTITVDPLGTSDNVTTFTTLQGAIDSLGNKSIQNTTINVAAGTYAENVVLRSILASNLNSFVINGDTRAVVGCGIAHGMYWNNTASPTVPLGGGSNSSAVLVGVNGGNTISVTVGVVGAGSINPDFTQAGGVAVGDRLAVRHVDGSEALYGVTGVAATTLTVSPNLTGDVNALGAAVCVVPNVELAPAAGVPLTWETRALLNGFMVTIPSLVDAGLVIRGPARCNNSGCLWWGGAVSQRSNEAGTVVSTTGSKGCTFMGATTEVYRGGGSTGAFANSLLAPAAGGRGINASEGVTALVPATRFLGNAALLQLNNSLGTVDATARPLEFYYTGTGAPVTVSNAGSLLVNAGTAMRIQGTAGTGVAVAGGAFIMESTSTLAFSSTTAGACVVDLSGSVSNPNPTGTTPATPGTASVSLGAVTLPASASAYLAKVSDGGRLTVNALGTTTLGAAANGFLVQRGGMLTWAAAATLTGGSGGVAFDVRSCGTMTCTGAAGVVGAFATAFSFDDNARGYLTGMTVTTDSGGTNLLVKNGARVVVGTNTFNVSGGNVGVSQINGGDLIREVGGTFTNNAGTPVLGPTVGTATGDLITPSISATATNRAGTISASTTTGGLAGSVTLTFSSAFAVAPTLTLTAAGAAVATNLRVSSISTTAAVINCTTPAGGGTAFSINYLASV